MCLIQSTRERLCWKGRLMISWLSSCSARSDSTTEGCRRVPHDRIAPPRAVVVFLRQEHTITVEWFSPHALSIASSTRPVSSHSAAATGTVKESNRNSSSIAIVNCFFFALLPVGSESKQQICVEEKTNKVYFSLKETFFQTVTATVRPDQLTASCA